MSIKNIKPKGGSFRYNPGGKQLRLSLDIQFHFNFQSQKFEINQQPLGEPDTRPMKNVVLADDFSRLTFDAEYRKQETSFSITTSKPCEQLILAFLASVNDKGFSILETDLDDTQIIFEKGILSEITIYKRKNSYQMTDSLDIFTEGETLVLKRQDPWEKIKLDKLAVENNSIISKSGDRLFSYHVDTQPLIFDTIEKLVKSGLPQL